MHDWAETLRESLRLKLEPGSDNLRPEYKLANDIVYGFRGRSVPALSYLKVATATNSVRVKRRYRN